MVERLSESCSQRVFGAYRRSLLDESVRNTSTDVQRDREETIIALQRAIAEAGRRSKRIARNLELVDEPDQDLIRDINERRAELRAKRTHLEAELADVEAQIESAPTRNTLHRRCAIRSGGGSELGLRCGGYRV